MLLANICLITGLKIMSSEWTLSDSVWAEPYRQACFSSLKWAHQEKYIAYVIPRTADIVRKHINLVRRVTEPGDFIEVFDGNNYTIYLPTDRPIDYIMGIINLLRLAQEGNGDYTNEFPKVYKGATSIKNPLERLITMSCRCRFNSNHRIWNTQRLAIEDVPTYLKGAKKLRDIYIGDELTLSQKGYTLPSIKPWKSMYRRDIKLNQDWFEAAP